MSLGEINRKKGKNPFTCITIINWITDQFTEEDILQYGQNRLSLLE